MHYVTERPSECTSIKTRDLARCVLSLAPDHSLARDLTCARERSLASRLVCSKGFSAVT